MSALNAAQKIDQQIQAQHQKISPFLWFDSNAEEAANFYVSIFDNSKILNVARYGDTGPGPKGSVMTISFQLAGQEFIGLNGGPAFKFNEAISLLVHCKSQEEVDKYWEKLSAGGTTQQCGWLKDKFGLSWQIVPDILIELLQHKDPYKARRIMSSMMNMTKIDVSALERAAE
jgi:predicted 3-demethylubiquinone-9 3-methyltransferase (glyoxalase superfamily)